MKRMHHLLVSLLGISAIAVLAVAEEPKPAAKKPDEAAVARARKTINMLDDVYKQTIVLITEKYVHSDDDFAAGSAAVLLFENVSKSGNQSVRLLDATGDPYDSDNVAKDGFEKEGVRRIKAGAKSYEQVVQENGKYSLRLMTPVPVVLDRCIMCHAHYEAAKKKGEAIGAISYKVPIE